MKNYIYHLFIILALTISCTRKQEESSLLSIHIGGSSGGLSKMSGASSLANSLQSVGTQSTSDGPDWNTALNPTEALTDTDADTTNNVNCIGVMIEGPEPDMRRNHCTNETTGTGFFVGRWAGAVPYSGSATVQIDVPSGSARTIRVVGWYALSGACTNLKSSDPDSSNMSQPVVIGQRTMDFSPGSITASVNIPNTINTSNFFDDCSGPDFDMNGGPGMYFGQGTVNATVTASNLTNNTSIFTGGSQAAAARVSTITLDPSYPNEVAVVAHAGVESDTFAIGDEVMFHATAGRGATGDGGTEYGSCGYRAWNGSYQFARITDKPSTNTYRVTKGTFLDNIYKDLDNNGTEFATPDLTQMTALLGATAATNNFCYLQMVKVQHLNQLIIDPNRELSARPLNLSNNDGGGIIVMRIKDYLQMGSSSVINMSDNGFAGDTNTAGQGVQGRATGGLCASNDTGSGGSCSTGGASAGGGGHGNTSGNAVGSASGGNGYNGPLGGYSTGEDCGDGTCLGSLDYKIFHGGAGGGANTVAGGNGGGIIMIYANKLKPIGGGGHIFTKGQNATGANIGGGGAGGSVLLVYRQYDGSGLTDPINDLYKRPLIDAYGGVSANDGGSPAYSGGGGAGGRTHVISCKTSSGMNTTIDTSVISVSGGAATAATNQGANGANGTKIFDNITCP